MNSSHPAAGAPDLYLGFDFYGAGNLGDDLMLAGFLGALKELGHTCPSVTARSQWDVDSQRSRFPEMAWRHADAGAPEDTSGTWWVGVGGTPFQMSAGDSFARFFEREHEQMAAFGRRVLVGIAAQEEIVPHAERFQRAAQVFDRISVRDAWSGELLVRHLGVERSRLFVSSDLAHIALASIFKAPARDPDFELGMILPGDSLDPDDLAAAASFLRARTNPVAFIAGDVREHPRLERSVFSRISNMTGPESPIRLLVPPYADGALPDLLDPIVGCRTLLSARYHGILAAAWAGRRIGVIARSSRVATLATELDVPCCTRPLTREKLARLHADARKVDPARLFALRESAVAGVAFALGLEDHTHRTCRCVHVRPHRPIIILGVPRTGTTLLRTILDSHPNISSGPESPWLTAHSARGVVQFHRLLCEGRAGFVRSFGSSRRTVTGAIRRLVDDLFTDSAHRHGKRRWAEKTPDHALNADFLLELFPDAAIIRIDRDPLDTAVSTACIAEHRKGVSSWHEANLMLGIATSVRNTLFNAVLRWRHWSRLLDRALAGRDVLTIRYEHLVREPEAVLRQVVEFLDEPFDPVMLQHSHRPHDLPDWEWGSADVRAYPAITPSRAGRAEKELSATELEVLRSIAGAPSPQATGLRALAALASIRELEDPRFLLFMQYLNDFAEPLGLRTFRNWSKNWEYPWLWFQALHQVDWTRSRLVDLGSELSPMPWMLALLGAHVTLIETDPQHTRLWADLRDRLRVRVDWRIVSTERLPLLAGVADVVTSFSVLEHQPDKRSAIREAFRVLRPGGLLAMSFDICEGSMGMEFPEWNGRALTMSEFESVIWRRPEAGALPAIRWNTEDIPAFLQWHRSTAPHHTYVVGAAFLTRCAEPGHRPAAATTASATRS